MDELNIVSILYLAFRLAPFILVSYFTLSSVFNQDLKGIIFLIGLLVACTMAILASRTIPSTWLLSTGYGNDIYENTTRVCNVLTLTKAGPLSLLPLSMVTFAYTFGFMIYIIVKNDLVVSNLPTIFTLSALIIAEFFWAIQNQCASWIQVFAAAVIGTMIGYAWSYGVVSSKVAKFQFFNGINNKETCELAGKQQFRCTIKSQTI
jgi:hypothetical protein